MRCLEEENKSLECEILELEGKQSGEGTVDRRRLPDYSLETVVEKLRREKVVDEKNAALLKVCKHTGESPSIDNHQACKSL